jgi:DNA polymerase III sliding clamp (beta) subunit (PCNA family)
VSEVADPFEGAEPSGGVSYGEFSFRVKRWVLSGLAEAVAQALPSSVALPALGCFRVTVGEGFLELAATDMERTILAVSSAVDAKDTSDGTPNEAFMPARRLMAILKESPDTDVTITVKKNQAQVAAGSGSWTLILPDSSGYPELVSPAKLKFAAYGRERLLAGLRAVRHVVCRDAGRPPLTQVEIKADPDDEGRSFITASDGTRFARATVERYPLAASCIPASALDDLTRILAAGQSEDAGIAQSDDVLAFRAGPVVLAVARRSTPFPDVDRLLLQPARENTDPLTVDRDELAAAVRRVRINADGETSAIVLDIPAGTVAGGSVTVVARDKLGNSATEDVVAGWAGAKSRSLCVNHVFLTEMLAAHGGKSCEFRLGKDLGKRRSMVLLEGDGIVQVIAQMAPALVGY